MIPIMSPNFLSFLHDLPSTALLLAAGTLLFQRGDPVTQMFAVKTGHVHLLRRQQDGAVFILQRAGPDALIAEASLMSARYHCAAETIAPTLLTKWSRDHVRDLIDRDQNAAMAYTQHLANEVRTARLRAEITSLRKVCDRLDAWLIWNGGDLPDKGSRHHLAQELNVSPEALYRELSRRKMAGL